MLIEKNPGLYEKGYRGDRNCFGLMTINQIEEWIIEDMMSLSDPGGILHFDAATDGEKPLAVWVDTCMQPSGVTLTSLIVSVIVVDSVSCRVMHFSQAGPDMLHIAEEHPQE